MNLLDLMRESREKLKEHWLISALICKEKVRNMTTNNNFLIMSIPGTYPKRC